MKDGVGGSLGYRWLAAAMARFDVVRVCFIRGLIDEFSINICAPVAARKSEIDIDR
jgi:hypothetical protein